MRLRVHAALWLAPVLLFVPVLFISQTMLFGNTDALFYTLLMKLSGAQALMGYPWSHWLMDADAGLGGPAMYFYPPLPYTLTALLTLPLSLEGVPEGFRMLAGMYAAIVASGYTSHRWLLRHYSPHIARMGALLYMLLPYHLIYIYLHFNLAQLWALAWLPLWMMAAEDLAAKQGRRPVITFALCGALVGYTHPLTLLAFGAVPVAYACWLGHAQWMRLLPHLFAAFALMAALLASYLAGLATVRGWMTSDSAFTSDRFSVFGNLAHVDSVLETVYLAIAVFTWLLWHRIGKVPPVCIFFITVLAVLWGMTLPIAAPLWHLFTPLQLLQFPAARLHSGMLVAGVFLACAFLSQDGQVKDAPFFLRPYTLWTVVAVFGVASLVRIGNAYRETSPTLTADYVHTMQQSSIVPMPYQLRWSSMSAASIYKDLPRLNAMPQAVFLQGKGTVNINWWKPGSIGLTAHVQSPHAVLAVRQRYVPAWAAQPQFDSGLPYPVTIIPVRKEGLTGLTLQRGRNAINLSIASTPAQHMATTGSIITLIILLAISVYIRIKRRHARIAA